MIWFIIVLVVVTTGVVTWSNDRDGVITFMNSLIVAIVVVLISGITWESLRGNDNLTEVVSSEEYRIKDTRIAKVDDSSVTYILSGNVMIPVVNKSSHTKVTYTDLVTGEHKEVGEVIRIYHTDNKESKVTVIKKKYKGFMGILFKDDWKEYKFILGEE